MSEFSILSYLNYLRDVNRKLIQRGGLDNTLYRKSSKQSPYYIKLDATELDKNKHFLNSLRHIQRSNALGLPLNPLIGIGLIVGKVEVSSRSKNIAAPLMFCNAELIEDMDTPNKVDLNTFWESCTLNYDFITTILGHNRDDETNSSYYNGNVSPDTLARFSEVEDKIDQICLGSDIESKINPEWVLDIMKYITENVVQFNEIQLFDKSYKFELNKLDKLVQNGRLVFIPHIYYFISPAVGELTTVTAMNLLIKQLQR